MENIYKAGTKNNPAPIVMCWKAGNKIQVKVNYRRLGVNINTKTIKSKHRVLVFQTNTSREVNTEFKTEITEMVQELEEKALLNLNSQTPSRTKNAKPNSNHNSKTMSQSFHFTLYWIVD